MIEAFLERYYEVYPEDLEQEGFAQFLDDIESDNGDDPLDELFGDISEGKMIDINTQAELIIQKYTPENLIQLLLEEMSVADRETLLQALMGNPDMLSALVLLKASQDLKIDIEVSIDDIIEAFEPSEDSPSFSFPF